MKKEKKQTNEFFQKNLPASEEASTSHFFKIEKQTPIPTNIDEVMLKQGRGGAHPSKTPRRAKHLPGTESKAKKVLNKHRLSLHPKTPLFLIDQREAFHGKRIKNLQVKERLLAARRLKSIGQQTQLWVESRFNHKVTLDKPDKNGHWQDPTHRIDRQFLIERVIKYLTEI